jgi:hypothetical protein
VLRYGEVATALALLSDRRLGTLVAAAPATGAGIGGTSATLEIAGVPVFVKRIPLTDLERAPDNVLSTANVFGLPLCCHYGVVAYGSGGFGTWREVAANTMTTNWVLTGRSEAFPLLYHWRVLPGAAPLPDELADVERVVAYWDGSTALRHRLHALGSASASVVLFSEHLPQNVHAWLADRLAEGPDAAAAACATVWRHLRTDVAFMNANGLLHFDAHFRNILTDGDRLYFADLGLANSPHFDLSTEERDFLARNATHDIGYAVRELLNWMVANIVGIPRGERADYLRRRAAGGPELVSRYAPVATVMNDFYRDVYGVRRTTPYPAEAMARALAALSPAER